MSRICLLFLALSAAAFAQPSAPPAPPAKPPKPAGAKVIPAMRPPLFFKEEWKQTPAGGEHDISQESVLNPALELKLYGEGKVLLTGKAGDENNPIHTWSGECEGPCGFALRNKEAMADLSGLARIRVNLKTSGFHAVRPMIKLADGTWLVGDRADASMRDWLYSEYNVADLKWLKLNIEKMTTTGNYIENPNLSKVDEIGFTDLHPGSGHGPGGWSDVAQMEVYAKSVAR